MKIVSCSHNHEFVTKKDKTRIKDLIPNLF